MYLKSLEINGFKSFAKKASLQFSSSISAIVGPNGSGKSNVAEAFRFVLGEQSIKSLRGKRGEDLIFNGGGDATRDAVRANRASVKLVFDNSRKAFAMDFDEIAIERIVHRDNSNEYLLNGSQVRLRDIVELLASAHIGSSGHHIISQGEADRILNANIRERREMIEDALGLKLYQYKKHESQKKLEKTEENMKQVESLRREIAPHLKFLKKQVEKIEKVEEMRTELRSGYREYLKREDLYIQHEKARLEQEKSSPQAELAALEKELAHARDVLTRSASKDAKSDEVIALEKKLHDVRAEKDSAAREAGKLEGEIHALRRSIEREKEKQSREEHRTVYVRDVETVAKNIDEKMSHFADRDRGGMGIPVHELKELFGTIKELLFGFIGTHKTKEDTEAINGMEKEITELTARRADSEAARVRIEKELASLEEAHTRLRQEIEKEKDSNRDLEKDLFRIMARQNELRSVLASLKSAEDKLALDTLAFTRELEDARIVGGREALDYRDAQELVHITPEVVIAEARSSQEARRRHIEKIKIRIEDSGVGTSAEVTKEYKEAEERDAFLARELSDLETSKKSLIDLIDDLNNRLDVEFKNGIVKINIQFQQFFTLMFGGGHAELAVLREKKVRRKKTDDEDADISSVLTMDDAAATAAMEEAEEAEEGAEGIDINVSLPRKKIKGLMMLSGGERALTSIALLFAISQVNPPPFIILDETDAALDEANSKKYGDMVENLAKLSQLIVITHNRETMSRAGTLYGVTMGSEGASKLLSIQFDEAIRVAK